jgi:hypothetical protein
VFKNSDLKIEKIIKICAVEDSSFLLTNNYNIYSWGSSYKINKIDNSVNLTQNFPTKLNIFNTKFKNILGNSMVLNFLTFTNQIFDFSNFYNIMEDYSKEPIYVKYKCFDNFFFENSCSSNGNCIETNFCECDKGFNGTRC